MLNGMRNLYPAFFTVATALVALVVAIAKEAGHLGQYGRGVPHPDCGNSALHRIGGRLFNQWKASKRFGVAIATIAIANC
jgi:hypothetical protein